MVWFEGYGVTQRHSCEAMPVVLLPACRLPTARRDVRLIGRTTRVPFVVSGTAVSRVTTVGVPFVEKRLSSGFKIEHDC